MCDAIGSPSSDTEIVLALGAKCKDINGRNQMGLTPLCQAVQVWLQCCGRSSELGGANGRTLRLPLLPPSHGPWQHRRVDALRYLLHRGDVDVDQEYGKGWTALSLACTTKAVTVDVMRRSWRPGVRALHALAGPHPACVMGCGCVHVCGAACVYVCNCGAACVCASWGCVCVWGGGVYVAGCCWISVRRSTCRALVMAGRPCTAPCSWAMRRRLGTFYRFPKWTLSPKT